LIYIFTFLLTKVTRKPTTEDRKGRKEERTGI